MHLSLQVGGMMLDEYFESGERMHAFTFSEHAAEEAVGRRLQEV